MSDFKTIFKQEVHFSHGIDNQNKSSAHLNTIFTETKMF